MNKRLETKQQIKNVQRKELLYFFYYLFFTLEYIIKLILFLENPITYISFQKEVQLHSKNTRYLEFRKPYKWIKYL